MLDIYVMSASDYAHYIVATPDEDSITDIRGVYLFDRSDDTCSSSLYKLALVYMKVIFTEEGQRLPEWERAFLQAKYSADPFGDIEWPSYEIDDFIDDPQPNGPEMIHFGNIKVSIDFDGRDHDVEGIALIEIIRKYFQVYPPF